MHRSRTRVHRMFVAMRSSYSRRQRRREPAPPPQERAMPEITWTRHPGYEDILYETSSDGIAKITINRPEVRNAFRPRTVAEMIRAFDDVRDDASVGVVILTGAGDEAFCSGGDQRVRGTGGYVGADGVPRLNVLDLQMRIRYLPKPVVAMVAGYAIGGGHVLHLSAISRSPPTTRGSDRPGRGSAASTRASAARTSRASSARRR